MIKKKNTRDSKKHRIKRPILLKITPLFALGMFVLILVSCTTTDADKATLILSTPSPYQAKTLLPDIDMTPASYDFTGVGPDSATFSFTDSQPPVMASNLEPGDWTITVNAKNASGTVIAMGEQFTALFPGQSQTLNIVVTPVEGYGTIDLLVHWNADDTNDPAVTAQLIPVSGSPLDLAFVMETEGTATSITNDIPTGYHTLVERLFDSDILVMGAVEVVRIVKDQTTYGNSDFYEINELVSITVNITPEMNDPITVTMSGHVSEIEAGEIMTVDASVPPETGNVVYVWYINGNAVAAEASYSTAANLGEGVYRLDVVAFTPDGSRAGSTTHTFNVVDNVPSISSITSSTADGTYTVGNHIDVTVTFSENVTLDNTALLDVTLDTGAVVNISGPAGPAATFQGTYTVAAGDASLDLDSTAINLSIGTIVDAIGNTAAISLPAVTIAAGSAIVIE